MTSINIGAISVMAALGFITHGVVCRKESDTALWFSTNTEEYENYEVTLEHPLPPWINGTYIKNGCGMYELGHTSFINALDGLAKLHSLRLSGTQTAMFTAKFLRSNFFNSSEQLGHLSSYLTLAGVEPPLDLIERALALYRGTDNTNVIVYEFGGNDVRRGQFVTLSDYWVIYEIDPDSLITKQRINAPLPTIPQWEDFMTIPSCSHALQEQGRPTFINLYSVLSPGIPIFRSIKVVRIHSATQRTLIASIRRHAIPYMHSFGITANYAVVFAHPVLVDTAKILLTAKPLESLDWDPSQPLDIYVVDLTTGQVRTMSAPAVFVMHYVNGFESDDGSVLSVDMITYPNDDFINSMTLTRLRQGLLPETAPSVLRYTINIETNSVNVDRFTTGLPYIDHIDLPTINAKYAFRSHCFIYGVSNIQNRHLPGQLRVYLAKKDVCGGVNRDVAWYKDHHVPSEPHYFPNPDAVDEDDGILMSLVLDAERRQTYVLFLDARNMIPVNHGYLPTWIPFSFHGKVFDLDGR